MPALCQPEAVLPQQMACLPQQLPLKPEGNVIWKAAINNSDYNSLLQHVYIRKDLLYNIYLNSVLKA